MNLGALGKGVVDAVERCFTHQTEFYDLVGNIQAVELGLPSVRLLITLEGERLSFWFAEHGAFEIPWLKGETPPTWVALGDLGGVVARRAHDGWVEVMANEHPRGGVTRFRRPVWLSKYAEGCKKKQPGGDESHTGLDVSRMSTTAAER